MHWIQTTSRELSFHPDTVCQLLLGLTFDHMSVGRATMYHYRPINTLRKAELSRFLQAGSIHLFRKISRKHQP